MSAALPLDTVLPFGVFVGAVAAVYSHRAFFRNLGLQDGPHPNLNYVHELATSPLLAGARFGARVAVFALPVAALNLCLVGGTLSVATGLLTGSPMPLAAGMTGLTAGLPLIAMGLQAGVGVVPIGALAGVLYVHRFNERHVGFVAASPSPPPPSSSTSSSVRHSWPPANR
jgi:hypothetical protein